MPKFKINKNFLRTTFSPGKGKMWKERKNVWVDTSKIECQSKRKKTKGQKDKKAKRQEVKKKKVKKKKRQKEKKTERNVMRTSEWVDTSEIECQWGEERIPNLSQNQNICLFSNLVCESVKKKV